MHGAEGNMLLNNLSFCLKKALNISLLSTALLASFGSNAQQIENNAQKSVSNSHESTEAVQSNMHHVWNDLLSKNVVAINNGNSTAVDYTAMKQQYSELKRYLNSLSKITANEFDQFSNAKQLAFLINAYNAWTVDLILTQYPNIKSIKDIGNFFNSPWNKAFIPLLGETMSLNNIEHDLIRGSEDEEGEPKYNEPRIHFAVNCASIGCPALRAQAYTADKLDQQLEEQTISFLSDTSRNFAEVDTLNLSSIFKWYEEDFEQGYRDTYSLSEFVLQYSQALKLNTKQLTRLKDDDMDIDFLDYNWQLNAHH